MAKRGRPKGFLSKNPTPIEVRAGQVLAHLVTQGTSDLPQTGLSTAFRGGKIRWYQLREVILEETLQQRAFLQKHDRLEAGQALVSSMRDFVYRDLPEDLQQYWDALDESCEMSDDKFEIVDFLFTDEGLPARKALFIKALYAFGFKIHRACEFCKVTRATVEKWIEEDKEFRNLLHESEAAKGDFFEACLLNLCADGIPAAVIHANKTFNRNRGYGEKLEVNHTGKVDHAHKHVLTLSDEDLAIIPLEIKKKLLERISERNKGGSEDGRPQDPRPRELTVEATVL